MALGSIGSAEAAGLLEEALGSWSWRVALASARALGQLRLARSVGPLQRVRQNHYYPAVRNLAEAALASIAAGHAVSALGTREETFDLLWPAPPGRFVARLDIPAAPATETRFVSDSTPRRELPPPLRNLKGLRVFAPHGRGWLAGTNMGEFGGGLYVVEPGRRPRLIVDDPISYIARTDGEIRVVSNRGQSSFPDGAVWRLRQAASGTLEAEPLVELPSESFAVREGAGGALAIETYLGRIVVEPSGAVRPAPAAASRPTSKRSCKPFWMRRPCWRSSIAWACLGIRSSGHRGVSSRRSRFVSEARPRASGKTLTPRFPTERTWNSTRSTSLSEAARRRCKSNARACRPPPRSCGQARAAGRSRPSDSIDAPRSEPSPSWSRRVRLAALMTNDVRIRRSGLAKIV